jgi:FKBP-type peptidyl-prolyl cis-trans isomerase
VQVISALNTLMTKNYSTCFVHFSLNLLNIKSLDHNKRAFKNTPLKNKWVMNSEDLHRRNFIGLNPKKFVYNIFGETKKVSASEMSKLKELFPVFETKSGLKIIDFKKGDGEVLTWGAFSKVNYTSYVKTEGGILKIDSTYDRKETFTYQHGNGEVNLAFEEAVHAMKIGGKRRVVVKINSEKEILNKEPLSPSGGIRQELMVLCKNNIQKKNLYIIFDIELLDIMTKNI